MFSVNQNFANPYSPWPPSNLLRALSAPIVAVGNRDSTPVPASAKVIDVSGKTIVPGFIAIHPHWTEIRRGVLDLENWSFLANLA